MQRSSEGHVKESVTFISGTINVANPKFVAVNTRSWTSSQQSVIRRSKRALPPSVSIYPSFCTFLYFSLLLKTENVRLHIKQIPCSRQQRSPLSEDSRLCTNKRENLTRCLYKTGWFCKGPLYNTSMKS